MYIEIENNKLLEDFLEPNDDSLTLVMYGRSSCGNCRKVKPKFKKIGNEHETVFFVYNDIDKYNENIFVDDLEIIPHFALFRGMKVIDEQIGIEDDFTTMINNLN